MKKHAVETGQRFHGFTIVREDEPHITPNGTPFRRFVVRCDCGKIKSVVLHSLIRGVSKSCGCLSVAPRPTEEPPPVENARWLPLTQGKWTLVDVDVFDALQGRKLWLNGAGKYASLTRPIGKLQYGLHRFVLGLNGSENTLVDHINCNTLDNRRSNLRFATRAENARNVKPRGKLKYKGVRLQGGKWYARISLNKKVFELGAYKTITEAARAYNEAAKRLHGEFAWLNPISDEIG